MRRRVSRKSQSLEIVHPHAAGIDVGAEVHYVAIAPDRSPEPIRHFSAFTSGIESLVGFLLEHGVDTVAMESTGPYWQVLYQSLHDAGLDVVLADPRQVKQPARRKSDVADCEWIRQLHAFGALEGAFVQTGVAAQLRHLQRARRRLIEQQAQQVLVMQEQLTLMNIKLQHVLRDLAGKTGLSIVDAIIAGERDPWRLAELRDRRCQSSQAVIAEALRGRWRSDCLLVLEQARAHHRFLATQIAALEARLESLLQQQAAAMGPAAASAVVPKRSRNKHAPAFDAQDLLARCLGVDLCTIEGVSAPSLLDLVCEIGFDVDAWPTRRHFQSWLGLSPSPAISGGKRLRGRRQRPQSANRAAQILKSMAMGLTRSTGPLGERFRMERARHGWDWAVKTLANRLAGIIYAMLRSRASYDPTQHRKALADRHARQLAALQRRAAEHGLMLVPKAA